MTPEAILKQLAKYDAVLTDKHFAYTGGKHGPAYVNIRAAAHNSWFMSNLGLDLSQRLRKHDPDLVIGPESLGRTLAGYTAMYSRLTGLAVWCDIKEEKDSAGNTVRKWAEFSTKFDFGRLITPGMRVVVVDDLITTGCSIKLTADLISSLGGKVVAAGAVARREPDIGAEQCGVPALEVLVEVEGFVTFTESECQAFGPCAERVPMVLRPGHGHEWIKSHPGYPVAD